MLRLNYVMSNGKVVTSMVKPESEHFDDWLAWLMSENEDKIFFYTVDSTDIF